MAQLARANASVVRRRRRSREAPLKKAAFTLHADVLDAVESAVDQGLAPNRSAFVEAAVKEKLQRTKRERLYAAYARAAQDPAFLADMQAVNDAFEPATADGLDASDRSPAPR